MSLIGKVINVGEHMADVEVEPNAQCQGCSACKGLLKNEDSQPKVVKVLLGDFRPKPGERVLVDLMPGEGSIIALLIFGLPGAAFIMGLFIAPYLCSLIDIGVTDFTRLVFGLAFMGLAFLFLSLFSGSEKAEALSFKVIEILK